MRVDLSVGSGSGRLAAACSERRIFVIRIPVVHGDLVAITRRPSRDPRPFVRIAFEFGRRLRVRLRGWSAIPGSRDGSVDAESELHALDGARLGVLAGLAAALFLDRALAQQIGGMVSFEIGSLKLLDTPARR